MLETTFIIKPGKILQSIVSVNMQQDSYSYLVSLVVWLMVNESIMLSKQLAGIFTFLGKEVKNHVKKSIYLQCDFISRMWIFLVVL